MGVGVSLESLINAPSGVVGSAPSMDLACRLRSGWRSSCLPGSVVLDRVFVEYVITWLWVRAGRYYICYVSS